MDTGGIVKGDQTMNQKNIFSSASDLDEGEVSRQEAINSCAELGERFIELFNSIMSDSPESIDCERSYAEMQDCFDRVKGMRLQGSNRLLYAEYLVDWFFTAGSDTECKVKEPYQELYEKLYLPLLIDRQHANVKQVMTGLRKMDNDLQTEELECKSRKLEMILASFEVPGKVVNAYEGPTVTRFEVGPLPGVRIAKIKRLEDDIALHMRTGSVRVGAPVPGGTVGIEIENEMHGRISIRKLFESDEFINNKFALPVAVGMGFGGKTVVEDLAKMSCILVGGYSGSDKSIWLHSVILSLLKKAKPDEWKLLLVDLKQVEFNAYNGIPYLAQPVISDPGEAVRTLQALADRAEERLGKLAKTGVSDLESFNAKKIEEGHVNEIMPRIVIIVEEMDYLMMVAKSKMEDAVCRLAQQARTAGIHLILATKRPAVDVITGLIKANIQNRIAFKVPSPVDSRTIIDMTGAEKLIGSGDMLFKPMDLDEPMRIQGAFVSDEEIENVVDELRES